MKIYLSFLFLLLTCSINAQLLINNETTKIHVGSNLTGLYNPHMMLEGFVALTYKPSKFQICMQGGPLVKSFATYTQDLPVSFSEIVQIGNTGGRARLNLNYLMSVKKFVGLQFQYKQINSTMKYWQDMGQIRKISSHYTSRLKYSLCFETGMIRETPKGRYYQVSWNLGMAHLETKVNGRPPNSKDMLLGLLAVDKQQNFIWQAAINVKAGLCVYGRK
jgi:hypothetical protein